WGPRLLWGAVALFCLAGLPRLDTRDDLRDWIRSSPAMADEARRIASLTGFMPTSQFLLLRAPDSDRLLARHARLAPVLDALRRDGVLDDYVSLGQILAPPAAQREIQARLAGLENQPEAWRALTALGL